MHSQRSGNSVLTALAICAAVIFTGCAKPSAYKTPVTKFRDASAVVIESTKAYLTELNKVERDEYIYTQANKPDQIQLLKIEQVQVFSKEGITTRLQALDQLADYTELLYRLANSDAPERIKAKASDLQTAVTILSGKISELTGADDTQFKTAAGKALPVIGEILKAFAERAIEDALKKAITAGADPVNQMITAIESDAELAYQRKRTSFSGARVARIDQYNREFLKGSAADPAKLKAAADDISAGEDRWEAFLTAMPTEGLEAMKSANEALVKFASTPKPSVTDFATFVDAIESFAATAQRLGQVVQELRGN